MFGLEVPDGRKLQATRRSKGSIYISVTLNIVTLPRNAFHETLITLALLAAFTLWLYTVHRMLRGISFVFGPWFDSTAQQHGTQEEREGKRKRGERAEKVTDTARQEEVSTR